MQAEVPHTWKRWMTSQIGYLKLLISWSILSGTLDFEIKRVACISIQQAIRRRVCKYCLAATSFPIRTKTAFFDFTILSGVGMTMPLSRKNLPPIYVISWVGTRFGFSTFTKNPSRERRLRMISLSLRSNLLIAFRASQSSRYTANFMLCILKWAAAAATATTLVNTLGEVFGPKANARYC